MANWKPENTVLTSIGLQMLAKAQVGIGKLQITKIVTSDTVSTPANNRNMVGNSSTIPYKQECVLMRVNGGKADSGNPAIDQNVGVSQITARVSNEDITDDTVYGVRQIIVFMRLIDLTDPNEDMGEVPYMVAQSEGADDYDFIPPFSSNPTAINYDLFILHAGVATIDISVKTAGYVDDDEFNEFKTEITNIVNNIIENEVGQNTEGMTFNVWSPQYTEDDDPSGGRQWSKSTDTVEMSGTKSAEIFNYYGDSDGNMAIGANCHVEGSNNVATSTANHIEGDSNHADLETYGTHIEGRRNSAKIGWFQHIEGERNQSSGYATHIEGVANRALNNGTENVGQLHIEGEWNTVKNGVRHHVEGMENVVEQGQNHHVEGSNNKVEQGSIHHVEGYSNTVTGSGDCNHIGGQLNKSNNCGEVSVSGRENIVSDSNQASVSGMGNTVSLSDRAAVSGLNNTVVNSQRAIVGGNGNTVTNSRGTNVSGDSNSAVDDCFESTVSGYSNQTSSSAHTIVSGFNNIVSGSDNSVVSGCSNRTSVNVCESVISGNSNKVKNDIREYAGNMLVSGYQNTVTDSSESIISGLTNSVTYVVDSIVSGSSNSILFDSTVPAKFVNNSFISGIKNTVERTERTIITGNANNVTDYKPNGVSGERTMSANTVISGEGNKLKGIFSSVVTGSKNNVTNVHDSFIGGRENVITSNVDDGASNCITCTGYRCIVTSSGHPIFATGSYNSISGNNSSVFGSNNAASGFDQVVMGHYNVEDTQNRFALIVGGGDKNGENVARKNILELDWFGNLHIAALYAGDIYNDDGSNRFNAWNIADGTGERSIVANDIANNHATAPYTMSVGFNTEATQDYAFASGLQSKAQGRASATFGWLNESTGAYSFTAGSHNKVKGESSSGFGFSNSIDSNSTGSMAIGSNNTLESSNCSLTAGMGNTSSGMCTATFGSNNTNKGNANLISGASNTISSGSNVAIIASSDCTIDSEGYEISNVAIIGGKGCIVKAINQANSNFLVTGVSNVVNDSSASIIGGASNNVYSMDSIVSGVGNTVSPKESSTSVGNIVGGSRNTVKVGNSLVVGKSLNSEKQDCSVLGEYNIDTANSEFIVGCGKSESTRLNGLRVSTSGDVYGNSAFNSTGADAAEWFEWKDGNVNKEDRRGLFVTLEGDKIVLADENTTYIHGIISACPSFVGNTSEDYWNNKFMKDVFGEVLYEEVTVPEETITRFSDKGAEETVVIRESHIEKRPILNPDFDPTKEYVPRSKRPEWSYVSCWGRLVVVDDGTCVPNGYCRPKKGGIATASETGFRVMKRVDDTHILVWTDGAVTIK